MKNMRWLQIGRSERGSGQVMFSLALVAVAGGVATYMTNNNERAVQSAAIQKNRDASQQANMTNMAALGALMRFPSDVPPAQQVASNPNFVPSVYPDPYIYGSNPGIVKLAAIKNPSAAARWGSNGQGEISVEGFNSGKLNDSAMDQVFENGGQLALTAATQTGDSKVRVTDIVSTGANAKINAIRVASMASVSNGNNDSYYDQIQADLTVPAPPKPEVKYTGLPSATAPLSYGQSVVLRLQGYGLMTSVRVASNGNNPATICSPAVPAAASSIRNSLTGGFSLGTCSFSYNPANLTPSGDPAKGYFDITITATGPGGVFTDVARVYAWNPPGCSFSPVSYATSQGGGTSIRMVTTNGGPISATPQMQMPVNGTGSIRGWHQVGRWVGTSGAGANTWTAYFAPGYEHGQAYIEGRVTGPGIAPGTYKSCNNIAWVNINQTVCYEHTQGRWYYLGQCYRLNDGSYMRWYAYGPQYQRCSGTFFRNPWCIWGQGNRDGGCFATGTAIKMGDGSTRPVEEIQNGDLVFNPLTGSATKVRGTIRGPEKEPMIELGYDGKVVRVTTKHPMLTSKGIKAATDLHLGDDLLGADRKYHRLTELRRLPVDANQYVFNFIMDDPSDSPSHHVVLADGILTGDLQLQQELEKLNKSPTKVARD